MLLQTWASAICVPCYCAILACVKHKHSCLSFSTQICKESLLDYFHSSVTPKFDIQENFHFLIALLQSSDYNTVLYCLDLRQILTSTRSWTSSQTAGRCSSGLNPYHSHPCSLFASVLEASPWTTSRLSRSGEPFGATCRSRRMDRTEVANWRHQARKKLSSKAGRLTPNSGRCPKLQQCPFGRRFQSNLATKSVAAGSPTPSHFSCHKESTLPHRLKLCPSKKPSCQSSRTCWQSETRSDSRHKLWRLASRWTLPRQWLQTSSQWPWQSTSSDKGEPQHMVSPTSGPCPWLSVGRVCP